jgi:hypothetical protein
MRKAHLKLNVVSLDPNLTQRFHVQADFEAHIYRIMRLALRVTGVSAVSFRWRRSRGPWRLAVLGHPDLPVAHTVIAAAHRRIAQAWTVIVDTTKDWRWAQMAPEPDGRGVCALIGGPVIDIPDIEGSLCLLNDMPWSPHGDTVESLQALIGLISASPATEPSVTDGSLMHG